MNKSIFAGWWRKSSWINSNKLFIAEKYFNYIPLKFRFSCTNWSCKFAGFITAKDIVHRTCTHPVKKASIYQRRSPFYFTQQIFPSYQLVFYGIESFIKSLRTESTSKVSKALESNVRRITNQRPRTSVHSTHFPRKPSRRVEAHVPYGRQELSMFSLFHFCSYHIIRLHSLTEKTEWTCRVSCSSGEPRVDFPPVPLSLLNYLLKVSAYRIFVSWLLIFFFCKRKNYI